MRRLIVLVACVLTAASLVAAHQQRDQASSPATGTAVLAGTISLDDARTAPVRRAVVTLTGTGIRGTHTTVTDDKGQFTFGGLPGGRYLVTAQKPAHVTMHYGSPAMGRGPGAPIAIADGQRVEITMRLPRGAVLAGVLKDDSGHPLPSGQMQVFSPMMVNGEMRYQAVRTTNSIITTDERGRYRVFGLPPGEYIVRGGGIGGYTGDLRLMTTESIEAAQRDRDQRVRGQAPAAAPDVSPRVAWVSAFAPGVQDRNAAQRFSLREGEEYLSADVTVSLGRVARVSGTMRGADGAPMTSAMVGLFNTRERSVWSSLGGIRPDAAGAFVLPAIGPGEYAFVGRSGDPGGRGQGAGNAAAVPHFAYTRFNVVGDDVVGVAVEFLPGGTVTGRVEAAGAAIPDSARLTLAQVDAIPGLSLGTPTIDPNPDGTFRFEGVPPGRYRVTASGLGPLHLQSAILADRETLDDPFEVGLGQDVTGLRVTVSPASTVVSGTLLDQLGRPAPEFAVIMFSIDRAHWATAPRRMTGLVRLDSQGAYRIAGLPPGSYYLSAVTDASPQQLADPAFLEELAAAALTVTLTPGEQKRQDLKLSGGTGD
ncbi:MAG: carboxypeptidase regulatory-like domain-containing protein [Acidobacteria bacterium]|nr:carboxypeptidase regulatory-like domain-containing protein [Acidobacteriota bacterium]